MASYPSSIVNLTTLFLNQNPSLADFQGFFAEVQAVLATLGTNPQGSAGTVAARLANAEAFVATIGSFGFRNIRITNNAATPDTKLDITADYVVVEGELAAAPATTLTVDLTATGKNGATHARAVNTWYYVWMGVNPTTDEACIILDDSPLRAGIDTTHGSLAGFTKWRRIGASRTGSAGSGNFKRFIQQDQRVLYRTDTTDSTYYVDFINTDTSYHDVDISRFAPPTTRIALVRVRTTGVTQLGALLFRNNGSTVPGWEVLDAELAGATKQASSVEVEVDAAGIFEAQWFVAGGGTTARIAAGGYHDPI